MTYLAYKTMHLIDRQLKKIKEENRVGLMTHVVVGYPDLETTEKLVKTMATNGADFIELQIPFSDPLADGPTIMKASEAALTQGTRVKDAFLLMDRLSSQVNVPLLFMAYYNTVFVYGTERFCRDAVRVGASGIIVPDIPLEEEAAEHFLQLTKKYNLYAIRVVSPASTVSRLQKNSNVALGFVYCMARQGITGAKNTLAPDLVHYLETVKKYFRVPLAVGFGISKKEHIDALVGHADVAIVGSAIIAIISKSKKKDIIKHVKQFLREILT